MDMNVWKRGWTKWTHPVENIANFFRCIKYSFQRITKGYSDYDVWELYEYLTDVIANSVEQLAETTHSFPGDNSEEGRDYLSWERWLKENVEFIRSSKEDYCYSNEYDDQMEELFSKWTTESAEDGAIKLVTNYTDEDKILSKKYAERENELYEIRRRDFEIGITNLAKRWFDLWD